MALIGSILNGGTSNHLTSSEEANGVATDFVTPGVVGAVTNTSGVSPATGGYAVNASTGMTIAVSTGIVYVTATPSSQASQTFRVRNTSTATTTISNNSSGSTKYDYIYAQAIPANLNNPNLAGDNAFVIYTSRSSSTSTDNGTPPTYGTLLAVVTVTNGAIAINNADISDRRASASVAGAAGNLTTTAATGADAYVYAAGGSANVNLNLVPKGTGLLQGGGNPIKTCLGVDTKTTTGTLLTTSYVTYCTVTASSSGRKINIDYRAHLVDGSSGATRTGHVRVQCDGTTITGSDIIYQTPATGARAYTGLIITHVPTTGSHTWVLQVEADTANATLLDQASLEITEQY